jgi:hypothetical protein
MAHAPLPEGTLIPEGDTMKPASRPLTLDRLREVLSYEPRTGVFRWRIRLSRRNHVGDVAGTIATDGRRIIQIDSWHYKASRLAWFYHYGRWPESEVDHRDLDKSNDRIKNLREASSSQNAANVGRLSSNRSGFKGVSVRSPKYPDRFKAQIRKDGKRYFLGYFDTAIKAHEAYAVAARKLHGPFARVR